MRPASSSLKSQDVLVLLKLLALGNKPWRQIDVAHELNLSPSEVNYALERLRRAGLISEDKRKPLRLAAIEFLVHGLKYVFPAEFGAISRGIPTSHSAPPLSKQLVASEEFQFVWPYEEGNARGMAIKPLYETVPKAAKGDEALYELLVLVDAIRAGRAREKELAANELKKRILKKAS